jgi:hypothetical protein
VSDEERARERAMEVRTENCRFVNYRKYTDEQIAALRAEARAEALKHIMALATMALTSDDPTVKETALRGIRALAANPQERAVSENPHADLSAWLQEREQRVVELERQLAGARDQARRELALEVLSAVEYASVRIPENWALAKAVDKLRACTDSPARSPQEPPSE